MTPKETKRSSRHSQQFHRSAKPGTPELPPLAPREWLATRAGHQTSVEKDDFSGDGLVSARLNKTRFSRCLFVGADLRQADLRHSSFSYSDFSGADLTGADLGHARFWHCDFTGAVLAHANVERAVFEHCAGLTGGPAGAAAGDGTTPVG